MQTCQFLYKISSHLICRPSASRERSSILPGMSSKYSSATTEVELQSNSLSQGNREIASEKNETVPFSKRKADIIADSRGTGNGRKKQNRTTKQPVLCISESKKSQELESVDINNPYYSGEDDLQEQKPEYISGSLSIAGREVRGIHDLDFSMCTANKSNEVKVSAINPVFSTLESGNGTLVESPTIVPVNREATLHVRANSASKNKGEFLTDNLDGKPNFYAETLAMNSTSRRSGVSFVDTPLRNRSYAADDCKFFFFHRCL